MNRVDRLAARGRSKGLFGWTSPAQTYDKMRQLDVAVDSLDPQVQTNVADSSFREAWAAWRRKWKAYLAQINPGEPGSFSTAKLGNVFQSDEIARQVDDYARTFSNPDGTGWRESYARQVDGQGRTVPPPVMPPGPGPITPPAPGAKPAPVWWTTVEIPWWGWALGLAGVGAVGFSVWQTWKKVGPQLESDRKMFSRVGRQMTGFGESSATSLVRPAPSATASAAGATSCGCQH